MAKVGDDIVICAQSFTGSQPYTLQFPEDASQTFKRGWILEINSANGAVRDPATDTPIKIVGIAAEDAHNDTTAGTHLIDVYLAHWSNVFEANVKQSGLADHVLAQADIGSNMAIQRDTVNNRVFLNASTTGGANIRVWCMQIGQGQPASPVTAGQGPFGVGDTNVRCIFQFLEKFTTQSSS